MKISVCASVLFAALSLADTEYFDKPPAGAVYRPGSQVEFLLDKMSDDVDKMIYAKLYRHDDMPSVERQESTEDDDDDDVNEDGDDTSTTLVQTLYQWYGGDISDDNSDFVFYWTVENDVLPGNYHVQMETKHVDPKTRQVLEDEDDDEGKDSGDQDDLTRSRTFTILGNDNHNVMANGTVANNQTQASNSSNTVDCMTMKSAHRSNKPDVVQTVPVNTDRKRDALKCRLSKSLPP